MHVITEDFGGNLVAPWFGRTRPSSDYFASNLCIYMFVMANLVSGKNIVVLYDERLMGKGAEALCALRFKYHFDRVLHARSSQAKLEKVLFDVMDNCFGQNKSQMMFKFMLSFSFILR
jgi:hypothetical protein